MAGFWQTSSSAIDGLLQVHVKLIVAVSSWTTIAAIINVLSVATWFVLWPLYTQVYGMSWGLAPNLWSVQQATARLF